MSRAPLPMKPFHLYDILTYIREKGGDPNAFPIGTTYAKTVSDACVTFKDNHTGDFFVVSDSCERLVTLAR